jgi:hypothetical protein
VGRRIEGRAERSFIARMRHRHLQLRQVFGRRQKLVVFVVPARFGWRSLN